MINGFRGNWYLTYHLQEYYKRYNHLIKRFYFEKIIIQDKTACTLLLWHMTCFPNLHIVKMTIFHMSYGSFTDSEGVCFHLFSICPALLFALLVFRVVCSHCFSIWAMAWRLHSHFVNILCPVHLLSVQKLFSNPI